MMKWLAGIALRQWILFGALVALVVGTVYVINEYNTALEEAVTLKNERDKAQQLADDRQKELDAAYTRNKNLNAALLEKGRHDSDALATLSRSRAEDESAARADPAVRAWLDQPIPDALRRSGWVREPGADRDQDGVPAPQRGATRSNAAGRTE